MRSLKDFFLGLGLGLIFVSIIWIVTLQGAVEDNKVITRAKELGMVFPKDLGTPEAVIPATTPMADQVESVNSEAPPETEQVVKERIQNFTVMTGSNARSIANELENLGIIEDADILVDELTKMQLTARIKARSYRFDVTYGPLDVYTVIKELTR